MSSVEYSVDVLGLIPVPDILDVLATFTEATGAGLVSTAVATDSGLGGTRGWLKVCKPCTHFESGVSQSG